MNGTKLNDLSIKTEDKDDDDLFMDSLSAGLAIAKNAVDFGKEQKFKSKPTLIRATNSLYPVSIEHILK